MKKYIRKTCNAMVILLALFGLYTLFMEWQYQNIKDYSTTIESQREYDDVLLYNLKGGTPVFLVKPENKKTLFFIEGFRALSPAGVYMDYFRELHEKENINIVVPVYGLQSWPFVQRNRGKHWHYQEDMRTVIQIYDAYTSLLDESHKVITASMSFGTLPNLGICLKAKRKPDSVILMSPLNSGLEFKASGKLVYWLSTQTVWLRYIVPYSKQSAPSSRASTWDIVNDEKNKEIHSQFYSNTENSAQYGYMNGQIAQYMEKKMIPQIEGHRITMIWGDSDLYFGQDGFLNLAALLGKNNTVTTHIMENTGHMVLLDNGEDEVKSIMREIMKQ